MTIPTVEPIYSDAYELLYASLPDIYRSQDARYGWQLKRWLSGIGQQYGLIEAYVQRMIFIAANDRDLRNITPPPDGSTYQAQDATDLLLEPATSNWTVSTGYGKDINGVDTVPLNNYQLNSFVDGANFGWAPYLPGGTYSLDFQYWAMPSNGTVTISIDGEDVATVVLDASSATNHQTGWRLVTLGNFNIGRGFTDIRFRFDATSQSANTKRINVGNVRLVNIAAGYEYSTSDLADPYSAEAAWLPWLGLLFGVLVDQNLSVPDQRAQISNATNGYLAGTKSALIAAVKPYLLRTKTVSIFDHSVTTTAIGEAGQWDVLIVTRTSETPSGLDLGKLLAPFKPAGVVLHFAQYETSWDKLESLRPHWQDGNSSTSWDGNDWDSIEETGLL